MADKSNELEIPEGWVLNTTVEIDGTEIKGFLCPETGQEFFTYDDLMRYVRYAKTAQLGIYAPDSEFSKAKQRDAAQSLRSSKWGKNNDDPTGCLRSTEKPEPKMLCVSKASSSKGKKKQQRNRK